MKQKFFIVMLTIISVIAFNSCKPTDEDYENSEIILGYWEPIDSKGDIIDQLPKYYFDTANNGHSSMGSLTNDFKWEIRRAQLKIYYDKSPSYYIAYDKYNSRSLMRINEVTPDMFRVTQFYGDGFQTDITFRRYDPEDY